MGLSASQARFLQLTARRSDIEYEAQQINFQRLQLSEKLNEASSKYQDAMNNRKMVFTFNNGTETQKVDLSYQNYKNYMNQQMDGITTSQDKYYLVSSSGNKIIVTSEEEKLDMISRNEGKFTDNDFLIVDDLNDPNAFQKAIQDGTYYFAQYKENSETGEQELRTVGWDVLGGGAIVEELDKSDDAQAEAEYQNIQNKVQSIDKKLELKLDQLETNREAIQTEIESVKKVMEDNIESSFKIFS